MCTHEASIDKQKRINDSTGLSAIKNLSIEKYEPIGEERFIRYTAFMSEFKEYVLSKPLKTVIKLNYLKSCLLGGARLTLLCEGKRLEEHWFCLTYMDVRLSNVSLKKGVKCIFSDFTPFLSFVVLYLNWKINICDFKMNSSTLKQCVTGLIMESEPEKQPVTKSESLRQSIKKKLRRSFRKLERKSSTTSQKSVLNSVD